MKVLIRVDASLEIGTGHVMRCLALSSTLRSIGARVEFICRKHEGHLAERIEIDGYGVHLLALDHDFKRGKSRLFHGDWLGAEQEEDAELCKLIIDEQKPDLLIVDHYAIDASWEVSSAVW